MGAKARVRVPAKVGQSVAAYEAADVKSRELAKWLPSSLSGDAAILPEMGKINTRRADIVRNNGYAARVRQIRKDSIVGHQFKLSYKPNWRVLGVDPDKNPDCARFVHDVEAFFEDYAGDDECRIDVEGKRTFSQIIRGGVDQHTDFGEILNSVEWVRRPGLQTAIKVINPERMSNPNDKPNTQTMRAGIRRALSGKSMGCWIRSMHESEARFNGIGSGARQFKWRYIPMRKAWGRLQMLHLFDPVDDGSTRGVSMFAPVLERFKMLDRYQKVILQNAILNAMYAMVIESEFDSVTALEALGGSSDLESNPFMQYMNGVGAFHEGANIRFDGVKIPHLFPNEKLKWVSPDAPEMAGFEDRLLQFVSAGTGMSPELLSGSWSSSNFASAKVSLGETWRTFLGDRELHKRHASLIFGLVLEEMFSKGVVRPPKGTPDFWSAKSAWCRSDWIGPGRTMIDGLKDVKELVLKLEAGLITYEKAAAILGEDYKELFAQQVREVRERKEQGLPPPSWMSTQELAPDASNEAPAVGTNAQTD
jgi:lambda family phage portal protein